MPTIITTTEASSQTLFSKIFAFFSNSSPTEQIIIQRQHRHHRTQHSRRGKEPPLALAPRSFTARRISITDSAAEPERNLRAARRNGLLLSLPPEIRDLIWQEAVDGKTVHLWLEDRRLKGFVCSSNQGVGLERCFMRCWGEQFEGKERVGVWGLLGSCRGLYSELIDRVYANTTFIFHNKEALAYLPSLIPPQRFHSITSLQLRWLLTLPPTRSYKTNEPYTPTEIATIRAKGNDSYMETWFRTWEVLGDMEGLRSVIIELDMCAFGWLKSDLDVVKKLRGGGVVMIIVPLWFESFMAMDEMNEEDGNEKNYFLCSKY